MDRNSALETVTLPQSSRLPVVEVSADLARKCFPLPTAFLDIAKLLCRSGSHPLIVGQRGIGKSFAIAKFAQEVASRAFKLLQNKTLRIVDCQQIPAEDAEPFWAGMRQNVQAEDTIWCLDSFGHLTTTPAGKSLKTAILAVARQPTAQLIGVLTDDEYIESIAPDADLLRAFQRIDLAEPDESRATEILASHAEDLSDKYELEIPANVIQRSISLTSNFLISDRHPAKSIRILRQVCEDLHFDRVQHGIEQTQVESCHIEQAIAQETGIPVETIAGETGQDDFTSALKEAVVGQDAVIEEINRELKLIKAGLNEPGKAASVMLFAGMTGVGKTELAKRIAEIYSSSRRLNTYTMANFTEPHSVSGIIGVPPGYVGFEHGGRLINELNADPYSVFLLDEAEKAHPNVWKPFLNLFDEGWIVDQRGVKAYADRAIFILTTNAGDRNIAQMTKSGKPREEIVDFVKQALSKVRHERSSQPVFPPAFLARIGRVVVFNPLDEPAMIGIADRVIQKMRKVWSEKRGKHIEVSDEVIQRIGSRGHELNENASGREGGRIIRKLIKDVIESEIQTAATKQPDELRSATQIIIEPSSDQEHPLSIDIRFISGELND